MEWEQELKKSISTIEQLREYITLTPRESYNIKAVIEKHPMRITRYYMSLIDKDNPDDPIRKMAVPSEEEMNLSGCYDTSGEQYNTKMPGLQHKYSQTALILATNRCGVYCRHCFRKRLVGLPSSEILHRFGSAVKYIEKHEEINNVLITGGDPFILSTRMIKKFLEKLSAINHLDFIRFGTRVPVTFPDRILEDEEFMTLLKDISLKKKIYVVTHFNHPKEITQKSADAVSLLIRNDVAVHNQSILLKGVNDDPEILAKLQSGLVRIGVNPYYVFQCRPVKRVKHHFQVPLYKGYHLVEESRKRLNGPSKRFRYVMSHRTGKVEVVGIMDGYMYLKYLQAKDSENIGVFFRKRIDRTAGWLDDFEEARTYGREDSLWSLRE